jgi:hypothetical protein
MFRPMVYILTPFIIFAIVGSSSAFGQWQDTFDTWNDSIPPLWVGDSADFMVEDGWLTLQAGSAGTSVLFTSFEPDTSATWEWEYSLACDFSPSSNNFIRLYLWTDEPVFNADLIPLGPSIYLQIGESGSNDALELFFQDGPENEPFSICRGTDGNFSSAFETKIRVLFTQGSWKIEHASIGGSYQEECAAEHPFFTSPAYTGILAKYTVSNSDGTAFDEISCRAFVPDTLPPFVQDVDAINDSTIKIYFNEALHATFLESGNVSMDLMASNPNLAFASDQSNHVVAQWPDWFPPHQPMELSIQHATDLSGNESTEIIYPFIWNPPFAADTGELQITEILADPSPIVGLPDAEFIEIFNATDSLVLLEGYAFFNSTIKIPLKPYVMLPGEYLILCDEQDSGNFTTYGPVMGLATWPALVNGNDSLSLKNRYGKTLDVVVYSADWFQNEEKRQGGWSLEKTNLQSPCESSLKWRGTIDASGGTPGRINSVAELFPDTIPPSIHWVKVHSNKKLEIQINGLHTETVLSAGDFIVSNNSIAWVEMLNDSMVDIYLENDYLPGMQENIRLNNVSDCWGNFTNLSFAFQIPNFPNPGELIFTEILFDPTPALNLPEAEFLEVFNASPHTLAALDLRLLNSSVPVDLPDFYLEPSSFAILCSVEDTLAFRFFGQVVGVHNWRSLSNAGDSLVLTSPHGDTLSTLFYKTDWHDPEKEGGGWSLERISTSLDCNSRIKLEIQCVFLWRDTRIRKFN